MPTYWFMHVPACHGICMCVCVPWPQATTRAHSMQTMLNCVNSRLRLRLRLHWQLAVTWQRRHLKEEYSISSASLCVSLPSSSSAAAAAAAVVRLVKLINALPCAPSVNSAVHTDWLHCEKAAPLSLFMQRLSLCYLASSWLASSAWERLTVDQRETALPGRITDRLKKGDKCYSEGNSKDDTN